MLFRCWHAKQLYIILLKMPICFLYVSCSSITSPPPPPRRATGIARRQGGSKRRQFPRGWGIAYWGFFPGGLGEIGELFINKSFSVEQAINYFAVTGVSKQVLLFALIIFHLRSPKCFFFFMAYAIGFFHTFAIGSWKNFRLSSCWYSTLDSPWFSRVLSLLLTCFNWNEKMKVYVVFSLN